MKNTSKKNETVKNNKSEKLTEDTFIDAMNIIIELMKKQQSSINKVVENEEKILRALNESTEILSDILYYVK